MLIYCDQPHEKWYEYLFSAYHNSPHNSKHLFDIYTLTHIWWSLLLTFILLMIFRTRSKTAIYAAIAITTIFELLENTPSNIRKYRLVELQNSETSHFSGDSLINIIGDLLANFIGIALALYFIDNPICIIVILAALFVVITCQVGFKYWIDFFQFLY